MTAGVSYSCYVGATAAGDGNAVVLLLDDGIGEPPLELCRVNPVVAKPVQSVMSKQWTGRFLVLRLEIVEEVILSRTVK